MTGAPGEDALDGIKLPSVAASTCPGRAACGSSPPIQCISGRSRPRSYRQAWPGRTLDMTARSSLRRIRPGIPGIRP